jgi:NAD(P)-dependent dehydrogenase (short-subunit alcohol dehydrogenase family)
MRLTKKVCVITGGTSGIGLAAAREFVAEGGRVAVLARGSEGLKAAQAQLGKDALCLAADVTRPEELARALRDTRERLGAVDVLFANAALVKLSPLAETSPAMLEELLRVNVQGTFATLQAALPVLARGASVIITTSWVANVGFAGASALAMSKAALGALVRVAAAELAPQGIRVNALCPGAIETPLWGKLGLPAEALQAAGAAITAKVPLARWGRPEELAGAALFLASADSSYVNGVELTVDGGLTCG